MFYTVSGKQLVPSSIVKVTPMGEPVSDFTSWLSDRTPEVRRMLGWYEPPESVDKPGDNYRDEYALDGDHIVQTWVPYTPVYARFQVSKLLLRKNLRAMQLEPVLNGLIASSTETTNEWNDAVTLDSDSPLVLGALDHLVQLGYLTADQTTKLLADSRSEYQV